MDEKTDQESRVTAGNDFVTENGNYLSCNKTTDSMPFQNAKEYDHDKVRGKTSQLLSTDGWEHYRNELIRLCFEYWEVADDSKSADSGIQTPPSLFAEKTDDPRTTIVSSGAAVALDDSCVAAKDVPQNKERGAVEEVLRTRDKSNKNIIKLRSFDHDPSRCVATARARQLDSRWKYKLQRGLDSAVERIVNKLQRVESDVAVVPERRARKSAAKPAALGVREECDSPLQRLDGRGRDAEGTWRAREHLRAPSDSRGVSDTAIGQTEGIGSDGFSEGRDAAGKPKTTFGGFFGTLQRAGRFRSWCGAGGGTARRSHGPSVRKRALDCADLRRRRRRRLRLRRSEEQRPEPSAAETCFRTAAARLKYVRGDSFGDPNRLTGLEVLCRVDALTGSGRPAEAVDLFVSAALPLSDDPESMIRRAEVAYDWKFFCHLSMWRYSYKD